MHKLFWMVFFSLSLSLSAFGQGWNVKPASGKFSEEYVSRDGNCTVSVFRNGKGVQVVAVQNPAPEQSLTQTIVITKRNFWISILPRKRKKFGINFIRKEGEASTEIRGDRDWDIFATDYSSAAQELPPSVRKLFRGFYKLK
jgi:hypothetical protein